ncbi:hypothetical protein SteCoe_23943 [Stentor coeruleus]|uniref:Protein kinase domain-containing protein n=1 Tax=Stentor coeruleus TaxID=5963 RepID=A0A1R2BIS3_9CILI|nr:hypothetical protein SteCoe_23943 [Stentor coeruleus]
MELEEIKFMKEKYDEIKSGIQKTPTIIHEYGSDIREKYHIGNTLEGSARSSLAQFHCCVHRDLNIKRATKSYYIADAIFTENYLSFPSHSLLNFDLIMNEIKALSELSHPNILRLYDVYFDSRYIHLVTDFCKGGELFELLYADQLSVNESLGLMIQILEGIKYMHSKSYCHRGLCIENIMFSDNNKRKIKIISFSGAIKLNGLIKFKYGSPMYMAPEVFQDNYNEKCDEWSAGVIFFTMVTGHQPFQSTDFRGIQKKVINCDFIRSEKWKSLPKAIKKFIKKILVTKNRPSADKILEFPVIKKFQKENNREVMKKLIRTIKSIKPDSNFSHKVKLSSKLKIAVYKILAPLNILHDINGLESLWGELDVDGSDTLLESDIANNIEKVLNKQELSHRAHQIIKKFDLDKRGCIMKDEFIGLLCDFSDKNLLLQAFNVLDYDCNGVIGPGDFDDYFKCIDYEGLSKLMLEATGATTLDYESFSLLVTKFVVN